MGEPGPRRLPGGGEGLPGRRPATLRYAATGYVAGLVLSVLFVSVVEAASGTSPTRAMPIGVLAADVGGLWIGLAGAAIVASRTRGTGDLGADFGLRIGAWWDVPVGGAVGLVSQYGLIPLIYLPFEQFDHSLSRQLAQPAQADTASVHTVAAAVVAVVLLAVGAPLVEELFFRGLVLRALLPRYGAPVAIVVSAVLFALAHFESVQLPGLLGFGAVLGVLAWRTGRLGPGIAAHAAFNASAVISLAHLH